jgi:N-acetylmuramoyl-L-alanine amidase
MKIKQKLIPTSNKRTRPGIKMVPKYITVHETDNESPGADASAHARLQASGNSRTASWHFTVDDKEIWQSVPTDEVAWHAGDGNAGPGNRQSIGIEVCVNRGGDFNKAQANAIWLIRHLMDKHNIPIERVVPHKHWSGKNCPRRLLPHWNNFIEQIRAAGSSPSTQPAGPRLLKLTSPMMRGEDVKEVQQRLGIKADGIFGPNTRDAVIAFQKSNSLTPDGIVGPQTRAKLFPPKPMYRVTVNGAFVVDTAYPAIIKEKVEKAVLDQADEIIIKKRGT